MVIRLEFPPDRIKRIRKGFKENTDHFSRRFEVTGKTVEAWEQGRRMVKGPALVVFRQLAEVLIDRCPVCSRILSKIKRKKYCRVCEKNGGRVLEFDENYIAPVKKGSKK